MDILSLGCFLAA